MLNHQTPSHEPEPAQSSLSPEPLGARLRTFQIADSERRGRSGLPRTRRWLLLALVVIIGIGGWVVWLRVAPDNVPEVEIYTFTGKPPREVLLDLSGFVVPRTRVVISPQIGGIVARVHLPGEGQKVKGGALLFEVEDTRYRADFLQAEGGLGMAKAKLLELENGTRKEEKEQAAVAVEQAKAEVIVTTADMKRAQQLRATGAMSADELEKNEMLHVEATMRLRLLQSKNDQARNGPRAEQIAAARAEVQQAQATRDRAAHFYNHTKIYAPQNSSGADFTVLERKVASGESIQADLNYTSLCTLADLTQMEAEIEVQERDLSLVRIGGPCEVIPDAYPDRVYHGHVNRRQPLVNRQRGVIQVKITVDEPDEYLLPDMNARVLLLKDGGTKKEGKDLPEIPQAALVPGHEPPAVFVIDGHSARFRRIEIGAMVGDRVQVRSGLRAEDKVILPGGQTLQDGQPVRLQRENKETTVERRPRS